MLVAAIIAAVWLLAASRWIAADVVVPWDSKNQFYAFFRFLAAAIHSDASPFWNPYHYGGHPSVADPQSLVFSPLFVAWAWFDAAPSMRTFDLLVYGHLLIGGLALGAIGLRADWPPAACVLAAAVFMFGGGAAGRLPHTGIIITYGLFPPALLMIQIALARRSLLAAAGAGLIVAALALGRNQVALLLSFVLAAAVVGEISSAERPLRYLRERLPVLVTMTMIVIAVVVAPLLLTLQFAALSNRPTVLLERALESSLYPANLATLVVPDIFGSHRPVPWGPNYETVPEVASVDEAFNYLFVGSGVVIVVLWFGIAGGWACRRGYRLVGAVLALSVLYMLGRYTPFFAWAFEWVPGIHRFRRPVDANFAFLVAVALMAGALLRDYVREGCPPLRPLRLAALAAGALAIFAWAIAFSARTGHGWAAAIELSKTLPLGLAIVALLRFARTEAMRRWAVAAVAIVAVGELTWWNTVSRMNAESRAPYAVLEQPEGDHARALDLLEAAIRDQHRRGLRPRVEVVGVGGAWQNLASVRGLEATNGYNPLRIGAYDRMISPGETTYLPTQRSFPASFDAYDCALSRALGLEYLVLDRPLERSPHLARRAKAALLHAGPKVWIYRLHNPTPRLALVRRILVADADSTDSLGQPLLAPSPDRVLIDDDTPPSPLFHQLDGLASRGRAQIASWRLDRVEVDVDSPDRNVLVMHDTYYPGWVAEVDDRPARIMRADLLFRAVELSPGRHRVVFRYAPFSLENLGQALATAMGR